MMFLKTDTSPLQDGKAITISYEGFMTDSYVSSTHWNDFRELDNRFGLSIITTQFSDQYLVWSDFNICSFKIVWKSKLQHQAFHTSDLGIYNLYAFYGQSASKCKNSIQGILVEAENYSSHQVV